MSISSRCKAGTPVSVCERTNLELAARHSKCPKTKIHLKMFLFRIFIHRSSLRFHFINAFISHLFSVPKVFYPNERLQIHLGLPGGLSALQPLTHSCLLGWESCFPGSSWCPTTVSCSHSQGSLDFCPKMLGWRYFFFDLKSRYFKSFMESVPSTGSKEGLLKVISIFCYILK